MSICLGLVSAAHSMCGQDRQQSSMFSYLSPEQRVRKDHPLRAIRAMTDQALDNMSKVRCDVRQNRPAFDCSGEVAAGAVTPNAVFSTERAAVDGGD
jgi:hypothetical protein